MVRLRDLPYRLGYLDTVSLLGTVWGKFQRCGLFGGSVSLEEGFEKNYKTGTISN